MIRELSKDTSHTVDFVVFDNISSSEVEDGVMDLPWDELSTHFFNSHHIRSSKDGPNIWPVRLKPRDQWVKSKKRPDDKGESTYRTLENVEAITMIVMDLDKPGCLDMVKEHFPQYKKIIYSTHSNSAETPYKHRLVMPVSKPITPEQWDTETFDMMRALTDGDRSCRNLSRLYYLPSHSPNAGIDPTLEKTDGQSITPEDIKTIYNKFLKQNPGADRPRKKGSQQYLEPQIRTNLNYTYDGMCHRHASRIRGYLQNDDNRHSFALGTIYHEALSNKEEMNIPATIKFIFRAAKEFSSKPLHLGNTISEIPEMLSSAIAKEAPGIIKKFKSQADYSVFVEKCIKTALNESMTEQWNFPKYRPKSTTVDKIDPYTKKSFVERNKNSIVSLFSNGINTEALAEIFSEEAKSSFASYGKTIDYLDMALKKLGDRDSMTTISKAIEASEIAPEEKQKARVAVSIFKAKNPSPSIEESHSPSP